MIITFDNSDSAVQAYELLRVAIYEDKKLLGEPYTTSSKSGTRCNGGFLLVNAMMMTMMWSYPSVMLLPTLKPSMLPANVCPLLVFVNVKSGGGQGLQLISRYEKNPPVSAEVFDKLLIH